MVVGWSLIFIVLGWRQHDRFATGVLDLGIYDQGIWLLSRFKDPFVTVRGLELFGHHMNPVLVLLVPFYWLGGGPQVLLVVQVAAQASGAIAVFLLARDRLGERWPAVALAGALLLHPSYQFQVWGYFHPDSLAVGPLLFAYWAARSQRWRWFAVAVVLAVACKEDVALAVVVLGLLIAWWGHRRRGMIVAAAAAAWFVASTRLLIPWANGIGPFYDAFFTDFGWTAGEVARTMATRPAKVIEVATRADRLDYYRMMFAPVGFVALLGLPGALIGGPMLVISALSSFGYTQNIRSHYTSLVLVGIMVGTVEAIARFGRLPARRSFLVGLVMATSLAGTVAWGASPLSVKYHTGVWALRPDGRQAARDEAIARIPHDAAVSAHYQFGPHLTHRAAIYNWPEPFTRINWGVRGENLHDPATVQWLILDLRLLAADDTTALANRLVSTRFAIRFQRDDIVVAERVQGPG